jgi:Flp pilus assembly protein TadB
MSGLQIGALVAVLVGAALWCVARAADRSPRSMGSARAKMFGEASDVRSGAATEWVDRRFGASLELVELTPSAVVGRVVLGAGGMAFAVLAAVASLMTMGLLPATPWWFVPVLVLPLLAGWIMVRDVANRIERRRRELRQAANDFIQLVAVGLTTDQSVEEAIQFALSVGSSEAFDYLRSDIATAPQRGVPVWDAIDAFGRRCAVRELCEFAHSVERQGLQGVSISDTAATLAGSMRAKALDELEREADKANANLSGPTIGFVVTTIVFLAYPLAQRISDAFGG